VSLNVTGTSSAGESTSTTMSRNARVVGSMPAPPTSPKFTCDVTSYQGMKS
jgi:hypothetical protein